jgi:hypothetical protein
MVEEVAPGKFVLRALRRFPADVILPALRIHSFIHHRCYTIFAILSVGN